MKFSVGRYNEELAKRLHKTIAEVNRPSNEYYLLVNEYAYSCCVFYFDCIEEGSYALFSKYKVRIGEDNDLENDEIKVVYEQKAKDRIKENI